MGSLASAEGAHFIANRLNLFTSGLNQKNNQTVIYDNDREVNVEVRDLM